MPQTLESIAAEICPADCPVRRTASLLEGKWTLLIVRDLMTGRKRYNELQKSLAGISPRILAQRLRELEAQGLVMRTVYPTNPPTTDYQLTVLGLRMEPVITAMAAFGELMPSNR